MLAKKFEKIRFRRSDGQIQSGVIWNAVDGDRFDVRWFENGDEYGKILDRKELIRENIIWRAIRNYISVGLIIVLILVAIIVDGVVKKYINLEIQYQECVIDQQLKLFEFFSKQFCENRASVWNALIEFIMEFWSKVCQTIGLGINSFLGGLLNDLGFFGYIKLGFILTAILKFYNILSLFS